MWCTRWFLPLLLLPLPTAPPYFLLLFLFSLTMHAKPCFYCIVLLTTLFVSSCYWQPFPLDSPLSTPWADNVTTFADALNNTLSPNFTKPLPSVMRAVDRCWCDFSAGGLFEPFNVTHWEFTSVKRLKDDLERQQKVEEEASMEGNSSDVTPSILTSPNGSDNSTMLLTSDSQNSQASIFLNSTSIITSRNIRAFLRFVRYTLEGDFGSFVNLSSLLNPSPSLSSPVSPTLPETVTTVTDKQTPHFSNQHLPLLRKEYDLRPYGLGILVDFSWT